jgi:hypothetical protein
MPRSPWTLLLSLIGPALVLGLAGEELTREEAWNPDAEVQKLDELAEKAPLDVVVVGPSIARANFDATYLKKVLGKDYSRSMLLQEPASTAGVWYTMLKERVYAHNQHPRLVVMVPTLTSLLTNDVSGRALEGLRRHRAEPDDRVLEKSFGGSGPALLRRATENRGRIHDPPLLSLRTLLARFLFSPGDEGIDARVDAAGLAVFGSQHEEEAQRVLPGVEQHHRAGPRLVEQIEDSYLSDIATLVQENGGQLLIVISPVVQQKSWHHQVGLELEQALITELNRLNIGFIDMRGEMDSRSFRDGLHMTREGQGELSEKVAQRLLDAGILEGRLPQGVLPLRTDRVQRLGELPPLELPPPSPLSDPCESSQPLPSALSFLFPAALNRVGAQLTAPLRVLEDGAALERETSRSSKESTCNGTYKFVPDGLRVRHRTPGAVASVSWNTELPFREGEGPHQYWGFPETSLRWDFSTRWAVSGSYTVEVSVLPVQPAAGARLRVGDQEQVLRPQEDRLVAQLPVDPQGPWSIELLATEGYWVLRSLRLVQEPFSMVLVEEAKPRTTDLFAGALVQVEGEVPVLQTTQPQRRGALSYVEIPWKNEVGCSPLRVLEGGVPLPRDTRNLFQAANPRGTEVQHVGNRLYFSATQQGATTMDFDPDRHCWAKATAKSPERYWLYPGNRMEGPITGEMRGKLAGAMKRVELQVAANQPLPAGAALQFTLLQEGKVLFDASVPIQEGKNLIFLPTSLPREFKTRASFRIEGAPELPPMLLTLHGVEG